MKQDKDWKCEIRKVENGFILSYLEEIEEGYFKKTETLFEEKSNNEDWKDSMSEVFYEVMKYFGEFNSKHDKRRLNIEVKENDY